MGFDGSITLAGPKGGTVTLDDTGAPGDIAGSYSSTYHDYSSNGTDFYNGSVKFTGTALAGAVADNLTVSGADTGDDDINITFTGEAGTTGSAKSTWDGHTITGPNSFQQKSTTAGGASTACESRWPKAPKLQVNVIRETSTSSRLRVTTSIAGVGPEETYTDTQPVEDATVQIAKHSYHTNSDGIVTVPVPRAERITASAGETLTSTAAVLRPKQHPARVHHSHAGHH
jgi:hypothetical protein